MTNFFFYRDTTGTEEGDLTEPLVTFPDPDTPPPVSGTVSLTGSPSQLTSLNNLHNMSPPLSINNMSSLPSGQETMKFEQKKMTSASKTKVISLILIAFSARRRSRAEKATFCPLQMLSKTKFLL